MSEYRSEWDDIEYEREDSIQICRLRLRPCYDCGICDDGAHLTRLDCMLGLPQCVGCGACDPTGEDEETLLWLTEEEDE
jgi:hypothetical protein